jgi:hypothetical protein
MQISVSMFGLSVNDAPSAISESDRLRLVKYWLKGPKVRPKKYAIPFAELSIPSPYNA